MQNYFVLIETAFLNYILNYSAAYFNRTFYEL